MCLAEQREFLWFEAQIEPSDANCLEALSRCLPMQGSSIDFGSKVKTFGSCQSSIRLIENKGKGVPA